MSIPRHSSQQDVGPNLHYMEELQKHSELFREECKRLMTECDKACKNIQNDNQKQLDQRVRDITFVKKELEIKLEEINVAVEDLIVLQSRVLKALEACKEPLSITVLCLEKRNERDAAERHHDDVDRELLKEKLFYEQVVSVLQGVLEQITEQIRLNRSAKYKLEQDLKYKLAAQTIDSTCALMTSHSTDKVQESGDRQIVMPSLAVTPEQWEKISDINIANAGQLKTNSLSLEALVKSILEQTATDMQKQFRATTTAFQMNIQEIKMSKSQMEDQLAKILSEVACQQKIREDLQVVISKKEQVLALIQARLALRRQRPGNEQCFDPAQAQLDTEAQLLPATINKLHEAILRSKEEERDLLRCQLELQERIEMKANSLYLDDVICVQHRKSVIIPNF